jgi:hypothetical protein
LTSLAGAIDLSLNQFLAQKSLNEARAAGILDNAIEIELDEDDPEAIIRLPENGKSVKMISFTRY